jgi:hypothetical protein
MIVSTDFCVGPLWGPFLFVLGRVSIPNRVLLGARELRFFRLETV